MYISVRSDLLDLFIVENAKLLVGPTLIVNIMCTNLPENTCVLLQVKCVSCSILRKASKASDNPRV